MKKICLYGAMFAAMLMSGSCSSFLEQSSPSVFTPDRVYDDIDLTYKVLMGVYSKFNEDATWSQYLGINENCQSDTEIMSYTYNQPTSDDGRATANYAGSTTSATVSKTVATIYEAIERANLLIDGIEGGAAYAAGIQEFVQMHGEAVALRAQCYRDLIRLCGNVPFKMKPTQTDLSNVYLPKTDRFEIMEVLIEELQQYAPELPWRQATPERVTRGYAHGLCAQLALMRAGWNYTTDGQWVEPQADAATYNQIAMEQAKIVIDEGGYSLTQGSADYSGFEQLWRTINQRQYAANEVLFEIGFVMSRSSEFGYRIGPRLFTSTTTYGYATQGQIFVPIEYYYSFHPEDTRRDVSVYVNEFRDISDTGEYTNGVTSTTGISEYLISNPQTFRVGKWNAMWMPSDFAAASYAAGTKTGTGVNLPMMRYSDILLMYAEAAAALNGGRATPEAADALREVRQRAIPTMTEAEFNAYLASKTFLQAIKDERRWEFVGECTRKWDLIRWGELHTAILDVKAKSANIYDNRSYTFEFPTRVVNGETVERAIPAVVYYKYDSNNEMILDANLDYERQRSPGAEYFNSVDGSVWFYAKDGATRSTTASQYKTFLDNLAIGLFDTTKGSSYEYCPFYPIPADMIRDYAGVLSQDYGW